MLMQKGVFWGLGGGGGGGGGGASRCVMGNVTVVNLLTDSK